MAYEAIPVSLSDTYTENRCVSYSLSGIRRMTSIFKSARIKMRRSHTSKTVRQSGLAHIIHTGVCLIANMWCSLIVQTSFCPE